MIRVVQPTVARTILPVATAALSMTPLSWGADAATVPPGTIPVAYADDAGSPAAVVPGPASGGDRRGVSDRTVAQAPAAGGGLPPDGPDSAEKRKSGAADLFADDKAFAVNGFYGLEVAYTYAQPRHWSRGVNRLQLDAQGALAGGVKYKLGVRGDVDPVYYGSDFYLPDVKKNEQIDAIWRENYVDFSAGDWDFRLGAQNIVWGEVAGLFFADVVSARDMREFLLPSFDLIRIPQWAARAEYTMGDSHVEFVWVPIQTFDQIGKPGADFYPFPLPSPTSAAAASIIGPVQTPARTLGNSAYGVRANTLLGAWDVSLLYYRSFSSDPTFYRAPSAGGAAPLFEPRYDRIWQVGGTATTDLDFGVVRAEAVYAHGRSFASTDPSAPQGVVERPTLDYILSFEWPVAADARLNLQAFQRVYFGGGSSIVINAGDYGVSALLSGKVTPALEPQIQWIQTFGGGGSLIRPRLNWYPEKNTAIGFGVDVFTGPSDGYFGRFGNRDRLYMDARYSF